MDLEGPEFEKERRRTRQWLRLIYHTEVFVAKAHGDYAAQMRMLVELLSESLTAAKRLDVPTILGRTHVREVLSLLDAHREAVDRSDILRKLSFGQANLTRVVNTPTHRANRSFRAWGWRRMSRGNSPDVSNRDLKRMSVSVVACP